MKRNREQKFRIKIIQELHLKKEDQKRLDKLAKIECVTYKHLYPYSKSYFAFRIVLAHLSAIAPIYKFMYNIKEV